ncbi:MAG: hypothetical protein H5T92_05080, partial [Synergistales bacterium]|nr:hypothetical protein [Synergistales bacterium]
MADGSIVVAELLSEYVSKLHGDRPPARVLVIDLPRIDFQPLVEKLSAINIVVHLAYLDIDEADLPHLRLIAQAFGFLPGENLAWTVEEAERWRNTLHATRALVVVARSDQPKLTSFNEFSRVTAKRLKQLLCTRAILELSQLPGSNVVLERWWRLINDDDAIAFGSVLDYYLALQGCPIERYVVEVGKQLYWLGLLPDSHLLDNPDYQVIRQRVEDNRKRIAAIKELAESDRQAIVRGLSRTEDSTEERNRLERTFKLVHTLYDGGIRALSQLEYSDVVDLMRQQRRQRAQQRTPDTTRVQPKPLEIRVLEWLLEGDEAHLATLFDQVKETLENINTARCKEDELVFNDPSDPGGTRLTLKVVPKLFQVYESCFGDSLAAILDLEDTDAADPNQVIATFSPTSISDQWRESAYIDFLTHFQRITKGKSVHDSF